MWLSSLRRLVSSNPRSAKATRSRSRGRRITPRLEYLEDRTLLSTTTTTTLSVSNGDVASLISDIQTANANSSASQQYIISLASGGSYDLSAVDNSTNGANGLPVITAANLVIQGNGATIDRSSASDFRLLDVAATGNVTLQGLTLSGGLASGPQAQGGGLYNDGGTVTMSNVIFSGDFASADAGQDAQGGGIYSVGGSLTLNTVSFSLNAAFGGSATTGNGGNAQGGGLYMSGGSAQLNNCNISASLTAGGGAAGGNGGSAQGGGIYATSAAVTLSGGSIMTTINGGRGGDGAAGNSAHVTGGAGGTGGAAQGGGVFANGGSLTLTNSVSVSASIVNSGNGGNGGAGYSLGAGGNGGAAGTAAGGGVYTSNTIVQLSSGALINSNTLFAGGGGAGGAGAVGQQGGQAGKGGDALGGGLYASGGSVTLSDANTAIDANTALGGQGGSAGTGGVVASGTTGASGGDAEGGGLYAINAPVTVTADTSIQNIDTTHSQVLQPGISYNTATGGRGGNGGKNSAGQGGTGGVGGQGQGGGIYVSGSGSVTLTLGDPSHIASVHFNTARGGNGGSGGKGTTDLLAGTGGAGGLGSGGGVTAVGETVALKNATLFANSAFGGSGGVGATSAKGGVVGNYGAGANAQGGGLFLSSSTSALVLNSTMFGNSAHAGSGSSGGAPVGSAKFGLGGNAQGGALYAGSSTANVINSTFADNQVTAATRVGNTSNSTGGGTGQGGGLYSTNGTLTLVNDTVAWNNIFSYTDRGAVPGQGAGVFNDDATSTLNATNTIIALNQLFADSTQFTPPSATPKTGVFNDLSGTPATNDANLLGDANDGTNFNVGQPNQLFLPALQISSLGVTGQAPASYGGLTYTLPLTWSNAAINNGDATAAGTIATAEGFTGPNASASATDQRGQLRVIDGKMDIGATQTQLIVSGSAPATVQAGQTITYTLTVANNESTAVGVTLSDVIPANTTFQSFTSPAGWTVSAPALGQTGTVAASISSLAPNTTASFTLVVQVNTGIPGDTTITNNPTITTTGTATSFSRNVTLTTQNPGSTTTDITSKIGMIQSPVLRDPFAGSNAFVQGVLLTNNSGTTLTGPIALVLTGLTAGVTLTNATGMSNGSYYIDLVSSSGSWQAGWRHFLVSVLHFNNPNHVKISYTARIVQGI
jgi:uncharacterized repeat protein (TIGR01451 family)